MLVNVIGQILTIAEQLEFKDIENYEKNESYSRHFGKIIK